MEFNKLKGFWKSATTKSGGGTTLGQLGNNKINSANANNNSSAPQSLITGQAAELEALDEICPEVTSEGYGLRTPYGTHLNLDFLKYCEDVATGQTFRRTSSYRKPRSRTSSTAAVTQNNAARARLAGGPSSDSLDSVLIDGDTSHSAAHAENTLLETRRRLEAFRSFRSKRSKPGEQGAYSHPPQVIHPNGYTARRGSTSPGSSSGSATPNSLSNLLGSNQVTPQQLQIVREQMAAALTRLRELEQQVKTIPVLEVRISVLQQEKKRLLSELANVDPSATQRFAVDCDGNAKEENGALDVENPSPRSLVSASSGISSTRSSESSLASPKQNSQAGSLSPLPQRSSSNVAAHSPNGAPPLPPKRKYRSFGVGDSSSVWDIVCYSKEDRKFANASVECDVVQHRDFTSVVEPCDIDAAFDIFPSPPMQFEERQTNTEYLSLVDAKCQTPSDEGISREVQTDILRVSTTGCGDFAFFEAVEKSIETVCVECADASVMTVPSSLPTSHVQTTTEGLQSWKHAGVGNHVVTQSCAVETDSPHTFEAQTDCEGLLCQQDAAIETDSVSTCNVGTDAVHKSTVCTATSSDDLISQVDAASGFDACQVFVDASTETEHKCFESKSTSVSLRLAEVQDAQTLTASGSWCSYENMRNASCGDDECVSYVAAGTNTVPIDTQDQSMVTEMVPDVPPSTADIGTNTLVVETVESATHPDVIIPRLTSSSTNTHVTATESRCTQCDVNERPKFVDVSTSTEHVEEKSSNKEIDSYVDKVQSLLEEQQNILAENFDVFTDSWQEKQSNEAKISRFVNPALNVESASSGGDDEVDSGKIDPISASFSLMRESSSSADESDESDDDDLGYSRPTSLLPLPKSDFELKPILKKPGTPVREKKVLRFAEGVKMDDSSSEDETSDDEDLSEETESEEEVKTPPKVLRVYVRKPTPVVETKQWTYSKDFVKKSPSPEPEPEIAESIENPPTEPEAKSEPETPERSTAIDMTVTDGTEATDSELDSCKRYHFTSDVLDACDILEKHLKNLKSVEKHDLVIATSLVQREWFEVAAGVGSSRDILDDFVTHLADTSLPVLRKVVNMTDASGNTVLHYAISHGNLDIVELLLGIDELNADRANQAGYTAAMLAALCQIKTSEESRIIKRLFASSDINCHAKEAGQTALMLAVSHGRLETARLLLECGAEINSRDEDGSTALMCAAEHNHLEIVKLLLAHPSCDATLADTDGSTALSIAMDGGRKEIAILLYAQLNFKPVSSPSQEPNKVMTSLQQKEVV